MTTSNATLALIAERGAVAAREAERQEAIRTMVVEQTNPVTRGVFSVIYHVDMQGNDLPDATVTQ
jgi:uncharacterized protein YnzC (UPF0291/DUF896 family)